MVIKLSNDLEEAISNVSELIEDRLDELLQPLVSASQQTILAFDQKVTALDTEHESSNTVLDAMRYAALSGGKRLRPFLTVASSNLFGVSGDSAVTAAAAVELIHTYSLVHDDLPAMDDDDLRRGKPSCHIKFGEAAAILAGDALLTYAFEILVEENTHPDPSVRCQLVRAVSRAAGQQGMVGGQMMDVEAENEELNVDQIIRLQRLKTGELFAISCEIGAILGKAPQNMRTVLRAYAHDLGLAFQITDDLLDAEGTREDTGKEVNKDKRAGKATLVSVLGIERAREQAVRLAEQAKAHLVSFDNRADLLRSLADFVIERKG